MAVTAALRLCREESHVALIAKPLARAIAAIAIDDDDLVFPRANKFANFFDEKSHKKKRVVGHRHDTDRPEHDVRLFTSACRSAKESLMVETQENVSAIVLKHLLHEVAATGVSPTPYSHFYLEKAFPESVYAQMLELLPEAGAYGADNPRKHTRDDGLVTRNVLSLSEPALRALPEQQRIFWNELATALTSTELKRAVFARLSKDLSRRFRIAPEAIDSIIAYPKPALVKDLGGYEIAPHCDTRSKIVTMQFYLPPDASKADLGTAVYRMRLFRLKNLISLRNRFEKVKQFSFQPNSGYAFAVGRKSWHGRETVPMASGERNSLMLIYYAQPGKGW